MKIETKLSCGDKAWVFTGQEVEQLTVGMVRVEIVNSVGIGDTFFSNYQAQKSRLEQYMCIETGIGSGSVYTMGKQIFITKEECESANNEKIQELLEGQQKYKESKIKELLFQKKKAELELKALGVSA